MRAVSVSDTPRSREPVPSRPSRLGRLRRLLTWGSIALCAVLAVGAASQAALEWRDGRRHPAPGGYVTLEDGRHLHYEMAGMGNDGPLVVLEAGGGSFSPQWAWVQEQVAEFAPVISYDRAGLGWSDPATSTDRPPGAVSEDLFELLSILELDGPRIFVGHSFGAVFARMHIQADPDPVVAAVLVDPAHEDQFERIPEMANQTQLTIMPHLARVGLLRLLAPFDGLEDGMPPEVFAGWRAVANTTRYAVALRDEGRHVRDVVSPWLAGQSVDLGNLPVRILRAGDAEWPSDDVLRLQDELLDLSTNSDLQVVEGADHSTIVTHRHHARLVSEAVRELIDAPSTSG